MTHVTNGADFLVSQTTTQTHTHDQEVKASGEICSWSDWAWLTGGCLSFTLPARGLILPQQPCRFPCSRPLTGSRKRPCLSVSCPGSAALRLMTPTALRWQLRNKNTLSGCLGSVFLDSLIHSWGSCSVTFMACLIVFLISPLNSSFPAPWTSLFSTTSAFGIFTGGRLRGYRGDVIWPSHAPALHSSPWRLWEAALTNWPALCLSAARWDSAVPLWQILLFTQQRLGDPSSQNC